MDPDRRLRHRNHSHRAAHFRPGIRARRGAGAAWRLSDLARPLDAPKPSCRDAAPAAVRKTPRANRRLGAGPAPSLTSAGWWARSEVVTPKGSTRLGRRCTVWMSDATTLREGVERHGRPPRKGNAAPDLWMG